MACSIFRPIASSISFESCGICLGTQRGVDGNNQSTAIVGHIALGSTDTRVYHIFHETCLQNALASDKKCPTCRLENVHIISTLSDAVFEAIMNNSSDILAGDSELDHRGLKDALWLAAQMEKSVALNALIQLPCFSQRKEEIISEPEIEEMLSSNLPFLKAMLSSEVKFSDEQLKGIISKASQHERKAIIATLISSSAGQGDAVAELLVDLTKNLKTQKGANARALLVLESNKLLINSYHEYVRKQQDTDKELRKECRETIANFESLKKKLKKYFIFSRIDFIFLVILLVVAILSLSVGVVQNRPHYFGLMEAKNYRYR